MVIYRSANNHLLKKLDLLYHSAISFITNAPCKTHHGSLYSSLNQTSSCTQRKIHWFLLIYKTLLLVNKQALSHFKYNTLCKTDSVTVPAWVLLSVCSTHAETGIINKTPFRQDTFISNQFFKGILMIVKENVAVT